MPDKDVQHVSFVLPEKMPVDSFTEVQHTKVQAVPKQMSQAPEHPITQKQMIALLEPLENCLHRMERRLQETRAPPLHGMDLRPPRAFQEHCFSVRESSMPAWSEKDVILGIPPDAALHYSDTSACSQVPFPTTCTMTAGTGLAQSEDILSEAVPCERSKAYTDRGFELFVPAANDGRCHDICDDAHGDMPKWPEEDDARGQLHIDAHPAETYFMPSAFDRQGQKKRRSNFVPELYNEATVDWVARCRIQQEITGLKMGVSDRFLTFLEKAIQKKRRIHEPERSSWIAQLIASAGFETLCRCVIVLNAVLLGYTADWEIKHIDKETPQILDSLEWGCLIFFLVELILRLAVHRLYFFFSIDMYWNAFDLFLVSLSIVDVALQNKNRNHSFFRSVRLFKLGRLLRSARMIRFSSSIVVLWDSLLGSLTPLFWCLLLLAFLMLMFGLAFIQGFVAYLKEQDVDPDVKNDIDSKFGSLGRAAFSLYGSLTGADDWMPCYELVEKAGQIYGILFVFFITFSTFAVFNLMTGLIVEKAMTSAQPDVSEQILQHRKKRVEQKNHFSDICHAMDSDKSGCITWSEFQLWIRNPVMLTYMASIDLDVYDIELFFATVAAQSEDGVKSVDSAQVTIEDFVEGCMQMKGGATAIDMRRQLFETHMLQEDFTQFKDSFTEKIERLEKLVDRGFMSLMPSNEYFR